MTASICIAYEDHEQFINQWDYCLSNFKPSVIYVHSRGQQEPLPGKVMLGAVYIDSVADLPENADLVLLAPLNGYAIQGDVSLSAFVHPQDAIYFFGGNATTVSLDLFAVRQPDHRVYVETDSDLDMYSWVTWAVVAHDRRIKVI